MHPVCPALPSPAPSAFFFFLIFVRAMFRLLAPCSGVADLRLKNDPPLALHRSINSQPQKWALGTDPGPSSDLITAEFTQNILNTAGNVPVFFSHRAIIQNWLREKVDAEHWSQSARRFGPNFLENLRL